MAPGATARMAIRPRPPASTARIAAARRSADELRQRVGERHARERLRADGAEIAANGESGTRPFGDGPQHVGDRHLRQIGGDPFTLDLNFETGDRPRGERARQQQAGRQSGRDGRPPGWRRVRCKTTAFPDTRGSSADKICPLPVRVKCGAVAKH